MPIPEQNKQDIIQSGMNFMRSITEAYGADEGMKLWDTIASTLDPSVKGEIFFAMLSGDYNSIVRVSRVTVGANKIDIIKEIRYHTGCGLKEAKDMADSIFAGKEVQIQIDPKKRSSIVKNLRDVGCVI